MKISQIGIGLVLVASACADRFGELGEIAIHKAHDGQGGAGSACPDVTLPYPTCSAPTFQYDAQGCPLAYVCPTTSTTLTTQTYPVGAGGAPISTTTTSGGAGRTTAIFDNATCVTNGCWASCVFHTGGSPQTTNVGNTFCSTSPTRPTTAVVDNAVCVTNGCWTNCAFEGSGGAPSTTLFGNTTCTKDTQVTTQTMNCMTKGCLLSCGLVQGTGGTQSTTMIGNTTCAATTSNYSTTRVGDGACYTNGCHSFCILHNGVGGTASTDVVGSTSCNQQNVGGGTWSTTEVTFTSSG